MVFLRQAIHFSGFYLFYSFSFVLFLLPMRALYLISDLLFFLSWYFPGYRKDIVNTNLRNSFPAKSGREIEKISKGYYRHMCDSLIESFALIHMNKKQITKRFVWKNPGILKKYYDQNRSVVAVFGHYGNWEWLSSLPFYTDYRVLALYQPLRNVYFDRFMIKLRQKFGVEVVSVMKSYPTILKYHEQNIPAITLFLGDQRPKRQFAKYWTTFLNQDTPVLLGSEQIAKRLNHVVLFFSIRKLKRGYYEAEITPVTEDPGATAPYEITNMHTKLLEEDIIKKPEYWLWSHKRWKHKKGEVK